MEFPVSTHRWAIIVAVAMLAACGDGADPTGAPQTAPTATAGPSTRTVPTVPERPDPQEWEALFEEGAYAELIEATDDAIRSGAPVIQGIALAYHGRARVALGERDAPSIASELVEAIFLLTDADELGDPGPNAWAAVRHAYLGLVTVYVTVGDRKNVDFWIDNARVKMPSAVTEMEAIAEGR